MLAFLKMTDVPENNRMIDQKYCEMYTYLLRNFCVFNI